MWLTAILATLNHGLTQWERSSLGYGNIKSLNLIGSNCQAQVDKWFSHWINGFAQKKLTVHINSQYSLNFHSCLKTLILSFETWTELMTIRWRCSISISLLCWKYLTQSHKIQIIHDSRTYKFLYYLPPSPMSLSYCQAKKLLLSGNILAIRQWPEVSDFISRFCTLCKSENTLTC